MTDNHVGFRVKTKKSKKYRVSPKIGKLLPRSTRVITVEMRAQNEFPRDGQCKDKFWIQSIVASPAANSGDITAEMFNEAERIVQDLKLGVVVQKLDRNQGHDDVFVKGIVIGLLGVIIWFLVTKILRLIWSLVFLILVLVVKMILNIVSDKVEDLILKIVALNFFPVIFRHCKHFLSVLFERMWSTDTA